MAAAFSSTQPAIAALRGTLSVASAATKASKNVKAKAHKGLALVLLG